VEKVKTEADKFHEKRKVAQVAITQAFACVTHSLPDKPAVCWKEPIQGLYYPVTENNLNLWATMHVRNSWFILINIYLTIMIYRSKTLRNTLSP